MRMLFISSKWPRCIITIYKTDGIHLSRNCRKDCLPNRWGKICLRSAILPTYVVLIKISTRGAKNTTKIFPLCFDYVRSVCFPVFVDSQWKPVTVAEDLRDCCSFFGTPTGTVIGFSNTWIRNVTVLEIENRGLRVIAKTKNCVF